MNLKSKYRTIGAHGWPCRLNVRFDFVSGHDLTVREFEPHIGPCADISEPGACLGFSVPLSLSFLLSFMHTLSQKQNKQKTLKKEFRGAWVAQSVERPTSAQVMISQSVSSSPTSGFVLTAQSLEPALDSVSPSLSAPPPLVLCLSLSKINIKNKKSLKKIFLTNIRFQTSCCIQKSHQRKT